MNCTILLRTGFAFASLATVSLAQVNWTQVAPSGAPMAYGGSAFAENRNRLVAFGGEQGGFQTDATREFDPTTAQWLLLSPSPRPTPRRRPAMAFDAARNECVLFGGGFGSSTFLGDTWTWNGTTWTQKFPASVPPQRFGAAMAYDRARQVVVLFGGFVPSGQDINDVWEWDGTTWTQRAFTTAAPAARGAHRMAYDTSRGVTVLYGGYRTPLLSTVADTWTWDGIGWTQGPGGPASLCDQLFVYDSHRQRVVLFGGLLIAGTTLADQSTTWEWNGSTWTQRLPSTSPSARSAMACGFVQTSGRVVSGGGVTSTGTQFGTTFALQPTSPATVTSFGLGCPSSVGPVVLSALSMPYIGTDFVQEISGASPSTAIGLLAFGGSNVVWNGLPLPLDLTLLGAPGCWANVSVDVLVLTILLNGAGTTTWALPNLPGVVSLSFFTQAVVLDPAIAQPFQIAASTGRQFVIGAP